jgi:hypothetical protein
VNDRDRHPIAMSEGTQINQIGAPASRDVEITLAAPNGGYSRFGGDE